VDAAKYSAIELLREGDIRNESTNSTSRFHCQLYRPVRSKFVSTESLPKTGVFAVAAGDFSEILAVVVDFLEHGDQSETRESPGKMQAFRAQIDRNLRSSECLAGAGGIEPPNGGIKIRLLAPGGRFLISLHRGSLHGVG
jgi:hypothetical protein